MGYLPFKMYGVFIIIYAVLLSIFLPVENFCFD